MKLDHLIEIIPYLKFYDKTGRPFHFHKETYVTFDINTPDNPSASASGYVNVLPSGKLLFFVERGGINFDTSATSELEMVIRNQLTPNKILRVPMEYMNIEYKKKKFQLGTHSEDGNISYSIGKVEVQDSAFYDLQDVKEFMEKAPYPSVRFSGYIYMEEVSQGFISTETINVLEVRDDKHFTPYTSSVPPKNYIPHIVMSTSSEELSMVSTDYKLSTLYKKTAQEYYPDIFVKDVSTIKEWNRSYYKHISEYVEGKPKPFQYVLGFESQEEGVYEDKLNIYIMGYELPDKDPETLKDDEIAQLYTYINIGEIVIRNEVKGFDDRFRTFFQNFGIPDPKEYGTLFKHINPREDVAPAQFINEKSKELFLEYKDIFPYVGTYKALINAVRFLGYDDIYFREWYKLIKSDGEKEYLNFIAIDPETGALDKTRLKGSVSVDMSEFLNMKKLNKLTMAYRINHQTDEEDIFGVPVVENDYFYSQDEVLLKLYKLREWLEEHIVGVNCRISDVSGEGIYFQYFKNSAYMVGGQLIEGESIASISPKAYNDEYSVKLYDDTLTATVNISLKEFDNMKISDFDQYRMRDVVKYVSDLSPMPSSDTSAYGKMYHNTPQTGHYDEFGYYDVFRKFGIYPNIGNFNVDNKPIYRVGEKDPTIETWDVNNPFHFPFTNPLNAMTLIDEVTYSLELDTDMGNIVESVEKHKTEKAEDAKQRFYQRFKGNEDRADGFYIPNPINIRNNTISVYNPDVQKVDYQNLPNIRIRSGYIRRYDLPLTHKDSIVYEIVPEFRGSSFVYVIRDKRRLSDSTQHNPKMLSVISEDYIMLSPREQSRCSFEYLEWLERSVFVIENYKLVTTNISSDGKIAKDELGKFFKKEKYILDIEDGSITSDLDQPISYHIKNGYNYDTYLTETIEFERGSDNVNDRNIRLNYSYKLYNIPIVSFDYDRFLHDFQKKLLEYQGYHTILPDGTTFSVDSRVHILRQEALDKIKRLRDIRPTDRISDVEDCERVIHKKLTSIIDAEIFQCICSAYVDNVFVHDKIPIDVNHIGDYSLDVYGYDGYGNTYHTACRRPISVYATPKDIFVGTVSSYSNNENTFYPYNKEGMNISELFKIVEHDYSKCRTEYEKRLLEYKDTILDVFYSKNKKPSFTLRNRYYGISPYNHKSNILSTTNLNQHEYPNIGDYLIVQNLTEKAYDFEIIHEEDDYVWVRFDMSSASPRYMDIYSVGAKINMFAYDERLYKTINALYQFEVTSYDITDTKKSLQLKYKKQPDDEFAEFRTLQKTSYLSFYFYNTTKYSVVKYVNDHTTMTSEITIQCNYGDRPRFNSGQVIKIGDERVLRDDEYNSDGSYKKEVYKSVVSETSYRVVSCKIDPDKPYIQHIVIDGLVDSVRNTQLTSLPDIGFERRVFHTPARYDDDVETNNARKSFIENYVKDVKKLIQHLADYPVDQVRDFVRYRGKNRTIQPILVSQAPEVQTPIDSLVGNKNLKPNEPLKPNEYYNGLCSNIQETLYITYPYEEYVDYAFHVTNKSQFKASDMLMFVRDGVGAFEFMDDTYSFIWTKFNPDRAFDDWRFPYQIIDPDLKFYDIPCTAPNNTPIICISRNSKESLSLDMETLVDGELVVDPRRLYSYRTIWDISFDYETRDSEKYLYELLNDVIFVQLRDVGARYHFGLTAIDEYGNEVKTDGVARLKVSK